ncbi:MAG: Nif3-like dinuclear metal center hexameric protein [Actinomycetaceae bacterium]|nr:Nif3-like dinuclear metal center hexameric protein [Actinomycetaceae bacterium]
MTESGSAPITVGDVVAVMDALFPPDTCEAWDRVGLSVGDPAASVRRIGFAVDPAQATVDEALERGVDMLITHHPLYLRGTHSVAATTGKGRWVTSLIRGGVALFSAHTNADVAASTAALAELLGVSIEAPLDEETGIGGVGTLEQTLTLEEFARHVEAVLPQVPAGVLVGGDLQRPIRRVAICSGSGDSLLDNANAAGADVYVTADLRHHPATDHLWNGGCSLICATHWASEWPLLPIMAKRLAAHLPGLDINDMYISEIPTDPWSLSLRS